MVKQERPTMRPKRSS